MKILIISLEDQNKRRECLINSLKIQNLDFTFINAINGNNLPNDVYKKLSERIENSNEEINWEVLKGEVGCYLSHLLAYQTIISSDNDSNWFLILEDDVVFSDDFFELIQKKKFEKILTKTGFELIVLGFDSGIELSYKNQSRRYYHGIKKINRKYNIGIPRFIHYGAFGYLLSKNAALHLHKLGMQNPTLADYLLYLSPLTGIKLGILNKPLIFPNFNFDSNIRENHSFLSKELNITEIEKVSLKQKVSELFRKPKYEYLK